MSAGSKSSQKQLMAEALALLKKSQRRIEELESRDRDPIAVVGIGCRLPSGVRGPDDLWRLLREGRDVVGPVPADRWDAARYHDPDPAAPGKMVCREGAFVDAIDHFDAAFFGISPREAAFLDPQQRLLLEVAWEAMEHAGIAPSSLRGEPVGVFLGLSTVDYSYLMVEHLAKDRIEAAAGTGTNHSAAAGRLSYVFGFTGPSYAIDTACSSSLVALHNACESLRRGECDAALVGGANAMLSPYTSVVFSQARMLSPDGRCKAFAAGADGYGRGEGAAVVLLERAADARRTGRRILALVRGTAVNQDGSSGGITVPHGPAQEAVIRAALRRAGLDPGSIDSIEAHATGTALGDPIEMRALAAVFGPDRDPHRPLQVSSIKSNMGHLEAAAGIAGLIKMVLQLQERTLAPHLHFDEPSPLIPWRDIPVAVPTRATPWRGTEPLRGGVSSFGFSGTNAHAVLEQEPALADRQEEEGELLVLPLSAPNAKALAELAAAHGAYLATHPDLEPPAVCRTLARGRDHFRHRLAIVGHGLAELRDGLLDPGARSAAPTPRSGPRAAFLFDDLPDGSQDRRSHYAAQRNAAQRLETLGVRADLVLGAGIGELAAAVHAGVLAHEDAERLLSDEDLPMLRRLGTPRLRFLSLARGRPAARELATPAYWRRAMTGTRHGSAGLDLLAEQPLTATIGLGGTLLEKVRAEGVARLDAGAHEGDAYLVAAAYVHGFPVDWSAVYPEVARPLPLPTYRFQRRRFWFPIGRVAEAATVRDSADLADLVRDELAAVLRVEPDDLDPEQPLTELGIDSLMAVELRNRLQARLDVSLPMTRLLDDASLATITAAIGPLLDRGDADLEQALTRLEQMSQEEAERLLAPREDPDAADG